MPAEACMSLVQCGWMDRLSQSVLFSDGRSFLSPAVSPLTLKGSKVFKGAFH